MVVGPGGNELLLSAGTDGGKVDAVVGSFSLQTFFKSLKISSSSIDILRVSSIVLSSRILETKWSAEISAMAYSFLVTLGACMVAEVGLRPHTSCW